MQHFKNFMQTFRWMAAVFGGFALLQLSFYAGNVFGVWGIVIGLIITLAWGGFWQPQHHYHEHKEKQDYNNRLAEELMQNLRTGKKCEPFCVYLRSFRSENLYNLPGSQAGNPLEFERWLERCLSPLLTVCLGENNPTLGAARIKTSDAAWEKDVHLLMTNCRFILILPGDSDGIVKEVCSILSTTLFAQKAIFLMPPGEPYGANVFKSMRWLALMITYEDLGLSLPRYTPYGTVFNHLGFGFFSIFPGAPHKLNVATIESLVTAYPHLLNLRNRVDCDIGAIAEKWHGLMDLYSQDYNKLAGGG